MCAYAYYLFFSMVIAFMTAILMFTYLFEFGNRVLRTLHAYTIWSYMLQNISFYLFSSSASVASLSKYLYFVCCAAFTAALCFVAKHAFDAACGRTLGRVRPEQGTILLLSFFSSSGTILPQRLIPYQ